MRENTLLYLGAGIASFTIIVSIVTGLIYSQKKEFSDFKYGPSTFTQYLELLSDLR